MHADFNRVLPKGKINTAMKKLYLLICLMAVSGLFWIAGFPLPYLLNNYRLNSFSNQLINLPIPPNTMIKGPVAKKFGNLGTCSKHGDYFAEINISSGLSLGQLKKFYEKLHVQVPEVNNVAFSLFRGLGTHGPQTVSIEKIKDSNNNFIVYTLDADYWPNDFRCW